MRIAMDPASVIPLGNEYEISAATTDAAKAQRSKSFARYFMYRRLLGVIKRPDGIGLEAPYCDCFID
jgi:hypothetical protein